MQHEALKASVSDWVRGSLPAEQAEVVATHVDACSECQASAEAARALLRAREQAVAQASAHPSSDALAGYVVAAASEPIERLAVVGLHLKDCAPCRSDADLMRAAAQPSWWRRATAPWTLPRSGVLPTLVPAAAVLLLLAYPAWRGLFGEDRSHTQTLAGGGVTALVLQETLRAAGDVPTLRLRSGQPLQPFLLDSAPRGELLTVNLVREPNRMTWSLTAPASEFWDEHNRVIGVLIPAEALKDGDYRIELSDPNSPAWFSSRFVVQSMARSDGG